MDKHDCYKATVKISIYRDSDDHNRWKIYKEYYNWNGRNYRETYENYFNPIRRLYYLIKNELVYRWYKIPGNNTKACAMCGQARAKYLAPELNGKNKMQGLCLSCDSMYNWSGVSIEITGYTNHKPITRKLTKEEIKLRKEYRARK